MIQARPSDKEVMRVQQWLLDRVLQASERNPITRKFISYNHNRMRQVSFEIEQWVFENKVPEASLPTPPTTESTPA